MRQLLRLTYCCILLLALQPTSASAMVCENGTEIQHSFDSGASWFFCASLNEYHALEISTVHYQAPGDRSRQVLQLAHLGQLLLHYHDSNTPIALIGANALGGDALQPFSDAVCAGERYPGGVMRNMLCTEVQSSGLLAKYAMRRGVQGEQFRVYSVSTYNGLTFQIGYGLSEDGKVSPFVSMSGQPLHSTTDERFGNALINPTTDAKIIGTQATLLFTWRLVFAINGDGQDDRVEEFNFTLLPDAGNRRPMQVSQLQTETFRNTKRDVFRGWRVRDDSGRGYYLDPQKNGYAYRDSNNNWAQFEVAVTAFNPCQQHALLADNLSSTDNDHCVGSLDQFVNGDSLVNRQPVLWYSLARIYRPRAEDYPFISAVQTEFDLLPFDWTNASPFEVIRE